MRNALLDEAEAGIKIAGRNVNNLKNADDTTLMAESKEELKTLLMKVKEESEKVGLKINIQKTKILASRPITSWQIDGETVRDFIFLGSKITADGDCSHEIKRCLLLGRKAISNLDIILKGKDITLSTKGHIVKAIFFPSSHVWMWELDHKESWAPKNWCFRIVVLEKKIDSPLDCKELKPVNPKGNQPWIFIRRTAAEAPILWPPDTNSQLIGKDPDAGKDWKQEEKGMKGDEMVEWHYQFNGHEFVQTLGYREGQGSLVCCRSWGRKESGATEKLNKNNNKNLHRTNTSQSVQSSLHTLSYLIHLTILRGKCYW